MSYRVKLVSANEFSGLDSFANWDLDPNFIMFKWDTGERLILRKELIESITNLPILPKFPELKNEE